MYEEIVRNANVAGAVKRLDIHFQQLGTHPFQFDFLQREERRKIVKQLKYFICSQEMVGISPLERAAWRDAAVAFLAYIELQRAGKNEHAEGIRQVLADVIASDNQLPRTYEPKTPCVA